MQVDVIQILNQEVDVNEMHPVGAVIVGSTNNFFNFKYENYYKYHFTCNMLLCI